MPSRDNTSQPRHNEVFRSEPTNLPESGVSRSHPKRHGREMTDLKRLETEQALLAVIVNSSEDAIVSKDLNGIVTSWNQAAERIYGWKADMMSILPLPCLRALLMSSLTISASEELCLVGRRTASLVKETSRPETVAWMRGTSFASVS